MSSNARRAWRPLARARDRVGSLPWSSIFFYFHIIIYSVLCKLLAGGWRLLALMVLGGDAAGCASSNGEAWVGLAALRFINLSHSHVGATKLDPGSNGPEACLT